MQSKFEQNAIRRGEEGVAWLNRIPEVIKEYEEKWSIKVDAPFTLTWNYVAPVVRSDGSPAVLKIGFPKDKEFQTEIAALEVFGGEGIERLLEVDRENAVILIERVMPGVLLSSLEDDEEATQILAGVMRKLWKPLPQSHKFITISEWTKDLFAVREWHKGTTGPFPEYFIDKAQALFTNLIATQETPVLVHGDLHHDNVLSSHRNSWLAIDPKGIAVEACYETAAMLRNPYGKMRNNPDVKNILQRRIQILADELAFDPKRIQQWGIAQSVLSAVWATGKDGKGWEHGIAIAKALDEIVYL